MVGHRFVLYFVSALHLGVRPLSVLKEYCPDEILSASCADDEVLVVRSAVYGRMRSSRCVRNNGHDGGGGGGHPAVCRANVLRHADRLCSGRRSCRVHVVDSAFGNPTPCYQSSSAKMYLEIIYECLKVTMPVRSSDCSIERLLTVTQPFGYLSNFVAEEYGYGSSSCPWHIALSPGERVNITLIDFYAQQAADSRGATADASSSSTGFQHCSLYALLTESSSTPHSFRVCGGDRRERNVFISRTNSVEVKIMKRVTAPSMADKNVYFLLQFEAIGCPEPEAPRFGWSLRDGEGVLMGCNHSRVSWRLTCDGARWTGHIETCPAFVERSEKRLMVWGNVSIPFTVSLIVLIALAVIAVIIVLLISLLCIEWQKGNRIRMLRRRRSKLVSHEDDGSAVGGSSSQEARRPLSSNHSKTPVHQSSLSTGRSLDPASSSPSSSSQANVTVVRTVESSKANDVCFSSSNPPSTTTARAAANRSPDSDYVREMWPMVAVPHGNPPGVALLFGDGPHPTPPFRQGGYLAADLGGVQNGRGRCQSMLLTDSEDETHIYETPKYLRRERAAAAAAATMRLKGAPTPPQCRGSEEHHRRLRSQADQQPSGIAGRYASKTLPREHGSSVVNRNR